MEQKPYTKEQYERCLHKSRLLSDVITDIKKYPLTTNLLEELYKAHDNYINTITDVVNESCGL